MTSRRGAVPKTDPALAALRRRRSLQWWAIWAVLLTVMCAGWRVKKMQIAARERQLEEWQRVCQPLLALDAELATYPARNAALQDREALIDEVQRESAPARWLTAIGRSLGDELFVQDLRLSVEDTPQLSVRGVSRSEAAARRFVQSLGSSDVFAGVELESIESTGRLTSNLQTFTAQGQLQ